MKALFKSLFIITLLVSLTSCAGMITGDIQEKPDGIHYEGSNWNMFGPPPPGPQALADAYATKKRADADAQVMANYANTSTATQSAAKYLFVAINQTTKPALLVHPELGSEIPLSPRGGYQFLYISHIPSQVFFKNTDGKIVWSPTPNRRRMEVRKIFRGREVDLRLILTSQ